MPPTIYQRPKRRICPPLGKKLMKRGSVAGRRRDAEVLMSRFYRYRTADGMLGAWPRSDYSARASSSCIPQIVGTTRKKIPLARRGRFGNYTYRGSRDSKFAERASCGSRATMSEPSRAPRPPSPVPVPRPHSPVPRRSDSCATEPPCRAPSSAGHSPSVNRRPLVMNGCAARVHCRTQDGDVRADRSQRRADDGDSLAV